jgi:CO/xanthine dehydrogenase Mo-binding subunit
VEVVEISGPTVGPDLRAAAWAEVLAATTALATTPDAPSGSGRADVTVPGGGRAIVSVDRGRNAVTVEVWAGEILCPVTLRSYVLGAVHQALGMVWSEGIAVDAEGAPVDLTIRSFGILSARDMPQVEVIQHEEDTWPVNGSDATFCATLAAAWLAEAEGAAGSVSQWPTRRQQPRHQSPHTVA